MSDEPKELTIQAVLEFYGAKKVPQGSGWKAMRCVFHDDSTASASVNHGLNAFACKAGNCGMSGDPLAIIRKKEGLKTRGEAIDKQRALFGEGFESVQQPVSKPGKRRALGRERWSGLLE